MKKQLTKILSIMLVFVMVMCLAPPVEAAAAAKKPNFPSSRSFLYFPKDKSRNNFYWQFGEDEKKYNLTNLKSSNPKVATVSSQYEYECTTIRFNLKNPGTTTISFNTKIGSKTYNYKCKLTVTTYKNPIKTFKIGNKNYASKYTNVNYHNIQNAKKNIKGKLNFSAAKGWKIKKIQLHSDKTRTTKTIKNKSTISLKKNDTTLEITCVNKKTKQEITIALDNWY